MIIRSLKTFDSDYLKGIAILLIMFHNYFHILHNAPGENEFTFSLQNTLNLVHNLYHTPLDVARQLFSYYGHYGLQLFVFLSGYGLAKKYSAERPQSYTSIVLHRFSKLYPVLFIAVALLFIYKGAIDLFIPSKEIDLSLFSKEALLKLSLTANLIPGQGFTVSGPWWFFSLIFQLYLLAPVLVRIRKINYLLLLMAFSWLVQLAVLLTAPAYMEYLRLNFIGHLPEFCLGIYLARYGEIKLNKWWFVLAVALFIASAFNAILWIFSNTLATAIFIVAYSLTASKMEGPVARTLNFFGRNSLYFFTVHGLCRAPFVPAGNASVTGSLVAAFLYLLVVIAITLLFKYIVQALTRFALTIKAYLQLRKQHKY